MAYRLLSSLDNEDDAQESKVYGSVDSPLNRKYGHPNVTTALLNDGGEAAGHDRGVNNPFADRATAAYWRQVYEGCEYECRHVFDPDLFWSAAEEERLVRKLDMKVCLWAVLAPLPFHHGDCARPRLIV